MSRGFFRLSVSAVTLTLVVVLLGAWVRLEDAGLGCPDWPGCYGMLVGVPQTETAIELANAAYPERPVHIGKAWKEMIHRYAAGTLGLLVLALVIVAVARRREPGQQVALPIGLGALIVAQSILGMWTVTWQLKPMVVTMHLLGGMSTLALLSWLSLRQTRWLQPAPGDGSAAARARLRPWVLAMLGLVFGQIALGGWVSTNYAALACTQFPLCHGEWLPPADYANGFVLWRGLGVDYEFGVLDHPARTAIQLVHRMGAVVLALAALALLWRAWTLPVGRQIRQLTLGMVGLVTLQWTLGIANVLLSLPLAVAVGHTAGAALLMLGVLSLYHALSPVHERVARAARTEPGAFGSLGRVREVGQA